MGGGAILGGLWLSHREHSSGLTNIALGCSLTGAMAVVAVAATESMWIAVPAIVILGFCTSCAGTAVQTLIQLSADQGMRGRVMSLYALIFRGAPSIGALAAGMASTQFGLRWPVLFGAVLLAAVCLWTFCIRERIAAAFPAHAPDTAA
jgi:predicted MFS family arabinose efflux permease